MTFFIMVETKGKIKASKQIDIQATKVVLLEAPKFEVWIQPLEVEVFER